MQRAVAIGNFDGVHLGHQRVLMRTLELSEEHALLPTVLTFEPHPVKFFKPELPEFLLVSPEKKRETIQNFGVDVVFRKFDEAFSKLSPHEFVSDVLHKELNAKVVLVGDGFRYGSKRSGDVATLKRDCAEFGIDVEITEPVELHGEIVSSSRVRKAFRAGQIKDVTELMGRPHRTLGCVEHGDGIGHQLGFPTANVRVEGAILPAPGIYATYFYEGGRAWKAATYVGERPTFNGQDMRVESFVLDEDSLELYGEDVIVEWIDWIRGDKAFESAEALVEQMKIDVENARQALALT